ncbi:membrane protein insertion efficiency factor YidD [Iodobacter fluviatilis]|uniref:membrane protein insertion efficiency factor YidD n=1 Tax=Iodobacter fluviatilis TaxID=537 RepID=UPI001405235B
MRFILLLFIQIYKKYISPYKGFCCAYRAHTGRASCSTLGFRAIRRHGAFLGLAVLRQRMFRCGQAYQQHLNPYRHPQFQRGYCDLPCDIDMCDAMDCLSGCDWPRRKEKKNKHSPKP